MRLARLKHLIWPPLLGVFFAIGAGAGVIGARRHVAAVARQNGLLDAPIGEICLDQPTCGDLVHVLQTRQSLPTQVDWKTLERDGYAKSKPISRVICLGDATLGQLMLTCEWHAWGPLVYADKGILHISGSKERAPPILRTYDVKDVLAGEKYWNQRSALSPIVFDARDALLSQLEEYTSVPGSLRGSVLTVSAGSDKQRDVAAYLGSRRVLIADGSVKPRRLAHLSYESDPVDRRIPEKDFRGLTVRQAIEGLRAVSGVNILIDWEALVQEHGADPDSRVAATTPAGRLEDGICGLCQTDKAPGIALTSGDGIILVARKGRFDPTALYVARCYPFADSPRNRELLPKIQGLATTRLLPGWIIACTDRVRQGRIEDILQTQGRP
jgi:hypothetical protein